MGVSRPSEIPGFLGGQRTVPFHIFGHGYIRFKNKVVDTGDTFDAREILKCFGDSFFECFGIPRRGQFYETSQILEF